VVRWNKRDIPHKGWKYIGIEDIGEDLYPWEKIRYEQCEMCGKEKIRYVHILSHPEFDGELRVGCDCALKMIDSYVDPRENERDYKNKTSRRMNSLRQEWIRKTETGNYTLRYRGEHITIMKNKYDSGWGVIFRNESKWDYKGGKIRNLETAKLAAFEMYDKLHDR